MESVPQYRQFGYALLATATAFGIWVTWFQNVDGIWIMIGAIALFAVLFFIDGVVAGRKRARGEADALDPGDGDSDA